MLARLKTIPWKPWGFENSILPQEKQWKQPVDIIKNSWMCLCAVQVNRLKPIYNKQSSWKQAQFTSLWDPCNKLINKRSSLFWYYIYLLEYGLYYGDQIGEYSRNLWNKSGPHLDKEDQRPVSLQFHDIFSHLYSFMIFVYLDITCSLFSEMLLSSFYVVFIKHLV